MLDGDLQRDLIILARYNIRSNYRLYQRYIMTELMAYVSSVENIQRLLRTIKALFVLVGLFSVDFQSSVVLYVLVAVDLLVFL